MLLIFFCGLLAATSVLGEEKFIDLSDMTTRIQLQGQKEWHPTDAYPASPEIDSREYGITEGSRTTNCQCGWANRPKNSTKKRIVGGKFHYPHEFPFIAGVAHSHKPTRPHCGSVIISPRHIITAAHCTVDAKSLVVTLGEYDRSGKATAPVIIKVKKIIEHEEYDRSTHRHDISLLFLEKDIPINAIMGPACLPSGPLDLENQYVRIIGWGAQAWDTGMIYLPKKVDVRVVNMHICRNAWPYHVRSRPETQLCTHSRLKTACQGDSGGPVVWLDPETNRYTVVGLVSFGPYCKDDIPAVQTSVPAYLSWIHNKIEETVPGQVICRKI